jgi:YHS domain-containing protein
MWERRSMFNHRLKSTITKWSHPADIFKDPVCNMMVDETKTQHTLQVNGQKVYLYSAQCKSQSDENPCKYGY